MPNRIAFKVYLFSVLFECLSIDTEDFSAAEQAAHPTGQLRPPNALKPGNWTDKN